MKTPVDRTLLKKVLAESKELSKDMFSEEGWVTTIIDLLNGDTPLTKEDEEIGINEDFLMDIRLRLSTVDGSVDEFAEKIKKAVNSN